MWFHMIFKKSWKKKGNFLILWFLKKFSNKIVKSYSFNMTWIVDGALCAQFQILIICFFDSLTIWSLGHDSPKIVKKSMHIFYGCPPKRYFGPFVDDLLPLKMVLWLPQLWASSFLSPLEECQQFLTELEKHKSRSDKR